MTMNQQLAAVYGTPSASDEDLQKLAEAELFTKLAAENGIDLNQLSDEQVEQLWQDTFQKEASDEDAPAAEEQKDEAKDEEEAKEAAVREHAVKLAHAEEEQRAHQLGQIMAHSYVAELSKIAAAREAEQAEQAKEASAKSVAGKALSAVKGGAQKATDAIKAHPKSSVGIGAAVGFGAGRAASGLKKKEASAIDTLALAHAVKLAEANGLDAEEAAARVNAVHTLGLEESTKVASVLEEQVEIRALEFLEAAGYPVKWTEPAQG